MEHSTSLVVDQDTRLAARDWTGHRYVGRSKRNNIEITTVRDTTEQSTRTPKCRFELGVPKRTASDDDDKHMYIPPYDFCPESGDQRWREASEAIASSQRAPEHQLPQVPISGGGGGCSERDRERHGEGEPIPRRRPCAAERPTGSTTVPR